MGHVPLFVLIGMTDVFFWVHALRAYPPLANGGDDRPLWGAEAGRRPASRLNLDQEEGHGHGHQEYTKKGKGKGPVPPGPSAASVKFFDAFITKLAPAAAAAPAAPNVRCSKCPTGPGPCQALAFPAGC